MTLQLSQQISALISESKETQTRKEEETLDSLEPELKELYKKLKEAEDNFGDLEVRDALIELGDFFFKKDNIERALNNFVLAYAKAGAADFKIDICMKLMLLGFKLRDLDLLKKQVEQAKKLFEEGGDWERKNRFKAYEAGYLMLIRQFKPAALNLLDILATFNSPEMFSFLDFVKYTVLMSLVSLDRAAIRTKVVHAPEILSVIRDLPVLRQFMDSLFRCEYKSFMQAFVQIIDDVISDPFIGEHARYWSREMRVVVYSQFLESYRSVTLRSMAQSFGVSVEFLDKELSEFISIGRLPCKIDKVSGIIESNRPDARHAYYQEIVKDGDFLLNRLQKLARVLDV